MINMRHLRAFMAVAEELHFTKAAEVVCVSQPALSALIKQLEEWVEVQLIQRNTRQVELTQAGREYYASVRQMLRDFDQASHDLKLYKKIKRGKVSMAALPSLCGSVLSDVLQAFHARYPDIRLDVKDIPGNQIMDALTSREVDLACTYAQYGSTVEGTSFMKDSLALICPEGADLAKRKTIKWKQLVDRPVIIMAEGTTVRTLVDGIMAAMDLHLRIVLEPRLIATAIAYVRAGLGFAILPTAAIRGAFAPSLGLVSVDLVDPTINRDISVLKLKDISLSPAAAALREMILASSVGAVEAP